MAQGRVNHFVGWLPVALEDLGEMDRHKAKMDGMAAIYYWGMGR